MKISIVQAGIGPMTIDENKATIFQGMAKALEDVPDVIVLPELWNSGFFPEKFHAKDDYREEEMQQDMAAFAKEHGVNIIGGSMTTRDGDNLANRSFIYNRSGDCLGHYDKAHLFPMGEEKRVFTPGRENLHFALDGINCGIITCFELRMLEWVRLAVMGQAKILFVPMAWGLRRIPHMHLFARARAVENQCFVVAVNCTKMANYPAMGGGGSCIFSPTGEEILMTGTDACVRTVDIDISAVELTKESFDLFKERRPELYGGLL